MCVIFKMIQYMKKQNTFSFGSNFIAGQMQKVSQAFSHRLFCRCQNRNGYIKNLRMCIYFPVKIT